MAKLLVSLPLEAFLAADCLRPIVTIGSELTGFEPR
jgi:hypothetical protein